MRIGLDFQEKLRSQIVLDEIFIEPYLLDELAIAVMSFKECENGIITYIFYPASGVAKPFQPTKRLGRR